MTRVNMLEKWGRAAAAPSSRAALRKAGRTVSVRPLVVEFSQPATGGWQAAAQRAADAELVGDLTLTGGEIATMCEPLAHREWPLVCAFEDRIFRRARLGAVERLRERRPWTSRHGRARASLALNPGLGPHAHRASRRIGPRLVWARRDGGVQ